MEPLDDEPGRLPTGPVDPQASEPQPGEDPSPGQPESPPEGGQRAGLMASTRHRGVLWAGITVGVLFVGALVVAFLGSRVNGDAVPGPQPIASLAVIPAGYLVGTIGALYASPDGRTWTPARLPAEVVAVASDGTTAYVLSGGDLRATTDLHTFRLLASGVTGTVIAAGRDGSVEIASGRTLTRVAADGSVHPLPVGPPVPEGLLGLAVSPVTSTTSAVTTMLAGGPVSGLWQSDDDGVTWQQVLRTPTQGLLIDAGNPQRVLLATPGGLLVSTDGGTRWKFTDLRLDVHGLSQERAGFFAVGSDRVVYRSADGLGAWAPVGG